LESLLVSGYIRLLEQGLGHAQGLEHSGVGGFFNELGDAAICIGVHDTEVSGVVTGYGSGGDGHLRPIVHVRGEHFSKVHAIELVATENEVVVVGPLKEIAEILTDGIRSSLVPFSTAGGLLGREDVHEVPPKLVEFVSVADVAIERLTVELGENVDLANVGIQAVADGDIDQSVLAGQRDGGLGALVREGEKARALSSAHNDGESSFQMTGGDIYGHGCIISISREKFEGIFVKRWFLSRGRSLPIVIDLREKPDVIAVVA
jgi:hypothetical protein